MTRKFFRWIVSLMVMLAITAMTSGAGQVSVQPAYASAVCFVNANASGTNSGTSWANAYNDLQSALGSSPCVEVWVAAGTYKPTVLTDTSDPRSATFTLKNGVALYGGFTGTETLLSQRGWISNVTFLSGDIGATGNADNSYHVVTGTTGAVLDGFTIMAGNANGIMNTSSAYFVHGGGMLNIDGSSPTLANLIFSGNTALNYGGGMANFFNSSPILTHVIFINNEALGGGGMYSQNGVSSLDNLLFENNKAYFGGGLVTASDSSTLISVTFSNNHASSTGGGMFNSNGSPTLTNVTFAENTAGYIAGGISITNFSNASITNAIFWNNSAPSSAEIYTRDSAPTISDTIVKGGCPAAVICNNVINADPKLGPLADNGGFTQTRALLASSAAIDTGDNFTCAATDQRGVSRPQGIRCDLGAFELETSSSTEVTIDIKPGKFPNRIDLEKNVCKDDDNLYVAILTTPNFDALTVDTSSLKLGDPDLSGTVAPLPSRARDVDGDGDMDMALAFSLCKLVNKKALNTSSAELVLTAMTIDGTAITGRDSVKVTRDD